MRKRGAVFNKITALVLAIVMVAALIACCGAKPGNEPTSAQNGLSA